MINVLWTGGWDSTFRVLQAIYSHGAIVQPYYIDDHLRKSTTVEIETINRISEQLRTDNPEKGKLLLPVIIAHRTDLVDDEALYEMWSRLKQQGPLGSQYVWIAAFMRQNNIQGLELCIHTDDRATKFVRNNVIFVSDRNGGYYELIDNPGDPDLELFRGFRFPILNKTKVEMMKEAERLGFLHLMNLTWFCHSPTRFKQPCGLCGPCRDALEEGMGWRIPIHRAFISGIRRRLGSAKRMVVRRLSKGL